MGYINTFDLELYSKQPEPGCDVSPYQRMKGILEISRQFIEHFDEEEKSLIFVCFCEKKTTAAEVCDCSCRTNMVY